METCSVVYDNDCKSPANMEPLERARAVCFGCGLAVCTSPGCSLRMRWYDYGVRRICRQCARDHGRLEEFG